MILAIGGLSRSGKTKLSRKVSKWLRDQGHSVALLHQDTFVKPEESIPRIRDRVDWETPDSMDWSRWNTAIREAQQSHDWVIAEGLFALREEAVEPDKQLFVHISRDTFLNRKHEDQRWGPVPEWFIQHVWNSFLHYGQPSGRNFLEVSGEKVADREEILNYLF